MRTYYVVKRIGSDVFDFIADTDKGAVAHANMLNLTDVRHGYITFPVTEASLAAKREGLEKKIVDLQNAVEDISAVLGDREPAEVSE
jgi:hypothetical protein